MVKSILMIGNFSIGALEHQYVKCLKQFNWEIYTFDIQIPVQIKKNRSILCKAVYRLAPGNFYSAVNKDLIVYAKKIKPLVILVFKGMELFPQTVEELKKYTNFLVNYNPDHPFHFYSKGSGNKNVREAIQLYDLYGTYARKIAAELKSTYHVNSFVLPFGYDADIKFTQSSAAISKFGFIGAYDRERLKILMKLNKFPIEVCGDEKWRKKLKSKFGNGLIITGRPLYNSDYASYCSAALGIFNFLRPHNINESSHNMRTFEVPSYGGLLIANRTEEQSVFFEEDKEAVYFDSIEELKDKLSYLLKKPQFIDELKRRAYNRTQKSSYSYFHRTQQLDTLLNEHL